MNALNTNPQNRFPDAKSMLIAIEALEQMTINVHQEMEEKVLRIMTFEDDDETMLFKKKLRIWAKITTLKK